MTIEVLYPELCNFYGEQGNARYLRACRPEARMIWTEYRSVPALVREKVDLLYLGSMTERYQALAMDRLRPHRDALRQRIEDGMVVLATGNSLELFGKGIREDDRFFPALDLFPYSSWRDMENRHNSMFLGEFEGIKMVGYKSQFSASEPWPEQPFCTVTGGFGTDCVGHLEGFRYKNFFGTYLLGPLLVLNPLFTRYLLELLNSPGPLAFEKEAMEAYRYRLAGLEMPGVHFLLGEHG